MLEAVFISDLHLHPDIPLITSRFYAFMEWAAANSRQLYILGDFFHAWPGDDGVDAWSLAIANKLLEKSSQGLSIFYMHGNRDFLLGKTFANLCGMSILTDPTVIQLGQQPVLLSHGDKYCSLDKKHQRFRKLTRNRLFVTLFLKIPYSYRMNMVSKVRQISLQNRGRDQKQMDVVTETMLKDLKKWQAKVLIHGHTHKPGLNDLDYKDQKYQQYVLSDWDDRPKILCYHKSKGFEFVQPVSI